VRKYAVSSLIRHVVFYDVVCHVILWQSVTNFSAFQFCGNMDLLLDVQFLGPDDLIVILLVV
jgi:hypothetical protein